MMMMNDGMIVGFLLDEKIRPCCVYTRDYYVIHVDKKEM
jgi:hypothetical protein